jgi:uncharacterized protein
MDAMAVAIEAPPSSPRSAASAATIEISPEVARRYLALHHFLTPPRSLPTGAEGILAVFDRLGSLQFDPIEIAGRNHDLVLLSRVRDYRREQTDALLYEARALYETYNKGLSIVPIAELPWFRVAWDRARLRHEGEAFDEHAPLVEELGESGILGLRRRDGNRRVYDLVERLFPADVLETRVGVRDQFRHKLLSRFRAHGLLGSSGSAELWYGTFPQIELGHEGGLPTKSAARRILQAELVESGDLVPVTIAGIKGPRFVPIGAMGRLEDAEREIAQGVPPGDAQPGVAFLAALDPLVWDREFLRTLFGFDYIWEVYVPAAKRRWGYYVLPIFFGDRFVGRIEPRIERRTNELRIAGLWWEDGFDPLAAPGFVDAFTDAIAAHREFGGVSKVGWPRAARHRELGRAVRARLG